MCDFGGGGGVGVVKEGGDNDPSSNLPPKVRNRISSVDDDDGGPDSIDIGPHFPLSRGDELSVFRVILTIRPSVVAEWTTPSVCYWRRRVADRDDEEIFEGPRHTNDARQSVQSAIASNFKTAPLTRLA